MHPLLLILDLAAAVLLLLWAVRMVRTGIERACGPELKRLMKRASGTRLGMAGAGLALAALMQSSAAVALIVAGFAAGGLIGTAPGLAALLGADLGSALVVGFLSFDLQALVPLLILPGALLFLRFEGQRARQVGRILLGLAFVLIALGMVGAATDPLRHSPAVPAVTAWLARDPLTGFVAGALVAWALHSSVATLLVLVALAGSGLLTAGAGLPMVLGANVGSGLIAVWLTRGQPPAARRPVWGNLGFRVAGALAALAATAAVAIPVERLAPGPGMQLVALHVAFNLALFLLALPFAGVAARLLERWLPDRAVPGAPTLETILDRAVIAQPRLALASATRELLKMGETLGALLRPVPDLLTAVTPERFAALTRVEAELNWRHSEIKLYIAEVNRGTLSREEARRGIELTDFAINLEHAGDIVVRSLIPAAEERQREGLRFSEDGWAEICGLHDRVEANLQLALNVLVSGDLDSARQLVREKEAIRRRERESHERHLGRLQSGQVESIETSDLHLEIVRGLKEINSLLCTVAYPILTERGALLDSRLVQEV